MSPWQMNSVCYRQSHPIENFIFPPLHPPEEQCQSRTLFKPQQQDILFTRPQYESKYLQVYCSKEKTIGKGGFSQIYEGLILRDSRVWQKVAVKEYNLTKKQYQKKYIQRYEAEVEALIMLADCPRTVSLLSAFYLPAKDSHKLYLVLELCELGSLEDHLPAMKGQSLALQVVQQLCQYLAFAHQIPQPRGVKNKEEYNKNNSSFSNNLQKLKTNCRTVIHKDIKPCNILVRSMEGNRISIAVCDFGTASIVPSPSHQVNSIYGGTTRYQSPQIQLRKPYDSRTDCWSLALTIFQLFCRPIKIENIPANKRINYRETLSNTTLSALRRLEFPLEQRLAVLIEKCLQYDLEKRAFSKEIKDLWVHFQEVFQKKERDLGQEKKEMKAVADLIPIVIVLGQEMRNEKSRMGQLFVKKIIEFCRKSIRTSIERAPSILEHLQKDTLELILNRGEEEIPASSTPLKSRNTRAIEEYQLEKEREEREIVRKNCEAMVRNGCFGEQVQRQLIKLARLIDLYPPTK